MLDLNNLKYIFFVESNRRKQTDFRKPDWWLRSKGPINKFRVLR